MASNGQFNGGKFIDNLKTLGTSGLKALGTLNVGSVTKPDSTGFGTSFGNSFPFGTSATGSQYTAPVFGNYSTPAKTDSTGFGTPFGSYSTPAKTDSLVFGTSFGTSTPTKSDVATQTTGESFKVQPDQLENKRKGVIALYMALGKVSDICSINIGISALKKEDLSHRFNEKTDKYLFIKTMYALIEETVSTPEELYKLLINEVDGNNLLVYALHLVKNKGATDALLFDTTNFLSAYCYALECFLKHDNDPVGTIQAAMAAPANKSLVLDLTAAMVGASYGIAFLPNNTINMPEINAKMSILFD